MNCPKCIGKLNKAEVRFHELSATRKDSLIFNLEVEQCFVCNGVWFDAGELEKYIREKLSVLDSPSIGTDLIEELDKKIVKCPTCQVEMVKKQAPSAKNITIDYCEKCRGIWLDSTELDRIESKNIGFKDKVKMALNALISK